MTMGYRNGMSVCLLPVYFLFITLFYPIVAQDRDGPEIVDINGAKGDLYGNASLSCYVTPTGAEVNWTYNSKPVVTSDRIIIKTKTKQISETEVKESILFFNKTVKDVAGEYICHATLGERKASKGAILDLSFPAHFDTNQTKYEVLATKNDKRHNVTMKCVFKIYKNPGFVYWRPPNNREPETKTANWINDTHIESSFNIEQVTYLDHNGIYQCSIFDEITEKNVTGEINLIVIGDPSVSVEVLGISKSQIYVKWTIDPANSKITSITCAFGPEGANYFQYTGDNIDTNATSYVINNLKPSTNYTVRLNVTTAHSMYTSSLLQAATLEKDPVFVPNISINGFSATSVTIGWAPPPKEIEKFIHYYLLEARKKDGGVPRKAYHSPDLRIPYMFDSLEPHSTYIFKARACQDFTKQCGNWSNEMEAATLDGVPGKPSAVRHNCSASQLVITWAPPEKPNAEIKGYTMELTGLAEYRDPTGAIKKETWGPLSRFVGNEKREARFDDLQPNTNYMVRLSAMTRSRRRGEEELIQCRTKIAPPDARPRPRWRKIMDDMRYLFKMYLPKISERNGPICCYRVYMVRMLSSKNLKNPQSLEVIDYEDAHAAVPIEGAYMTDIFTNDNFPVDGEIILGDEHSIFNASILNTDACKHCLIRPVREIPETPPPKLATAPTTEADDEEDDTTTTTVLPSTTTEQSRAKRHQPHSDSFKTYGDMPTMQDAPKAEVNDKDMVKVKDGPLDSTSNYTVFVELIPYPVDNITTEAIYSDFLNQLMPAPSPVASIPATTLEIALQATCAVAGLALVCMVLFCVVATRRSRKLPPHAHIEMSSIQRALRYVWPPYSRYGQAAGGGPPPDLPPIAREDLALAYADRHADCDYGFQKEFEQLQMLSECFPDRTTHASEARENQSKNRYPDIKAYDQTRVKLSQIDGITGSDYINANYVMGYKERKKFICAQGPTDTTVNDFWRMIWEHGLELIVMLTNLEEYSKIKCSKYWPDEVRGSKAFGAINVQHISEKRYSDYIVRELKITKQPTNSEGQPIIENNGVAKRNGDIKEGSESVPTSPREVKEVESRVVRQYHFLMWKDFAAPEHPQSILKFIKRVNEAWSSMVGRPCVVHCSAGVGRTGTLVALDCLLDQLRHTQHAAVFNTIAELRRQRNFLVQSQKQYVFVYRALVEYAHYGDTEISASKLKTAIDRLRNTPEGADKCTMEHEFEKMIDSPVAEAVKSCAAGQAEELRSRNRSQDCLPYDRNRVMLTPIPTREYSTYINASFVEAYDNSEGFIITQDPLPNTIFDFWRMVSEQSVSTIVMLSELGEGKCPRYWDDGTAQYEHISVQYDESESCPYYTRRQFRVTNNKTGHTLSVRQLQYQGWPTAAGHVPEVTRGLAELADAAAAHQDRNAPMVVHCNLGTERSALFVALCILICQLRTERRVDVSAVARKVRAQRDRTIDTFLQYEFLHRAILNYAELHNLLEDS